jgi:hypothetical protein
MHNLLREFMMIEAGVGQQKGNGPQNRGGDWTTGKKERCQAPFLGSLRSLVFKEKRMKHGYNIAR